MAALRRSNMLAACPLLSVLSLPLAQASDMVAPVWILVLCIVAGVGTVLLLPGPMQVSLRRLGGVLLALVGLALLALIVHHSARQAESAAHTIYFWIFSAIALFGAIRVVTHQRPVYSALYFVLTVFASSGLFVLLAAEFMAAALVIIYAGAILITYVFVIMLAAAARSPDSASAARQMADYDNHSRDPFVASAIGFVLMGVFLFVIFDRAEDLSQDLPAPRAPAAVAPYDGSPKVEGETQELGVYLFNNQQVSLELAGLLLTVAMVGAIIIARRRVFRDQPTHLDASGETVVFPATPVDDNPHSIPVYGTDDPLQKAYPEA